MRRIRNNKRFSKDNKSCAICGESRVRDNHHIITKSEGGSDLGLNRVWLCPNHHRLVHSGHIEISGWNDLGYKLELIWHELKPRGT